MMTLIISAWKEPKTIGKAVYELLSQARVLKEPSELILVCPDRETYEAAARVASGYRSIPFIYIKDPQKGKPFALNLAFKKAKGSIWVLTDGDVWIDKGALEKLIEPFTRSDVYGVTGRPVCRNERNTIWGYWGHLFMDAAHEKRIRTLGRGRFYAMSGYLSAIRTSRITIPSGVLDDVYLSCLLNEKGKKISYAPGARVLVRQPENWKDWISQKVRSVSGYQGLKKMFPHTKAFRKVTDDLAFALFPVFYARNPRELLWSLLQYPVRLWVWTLVALQRFRGKTAADLWIGKRIESTK